MKIYISGKSYIAVDNWLAEGLAIWDSSDFAVKRDYFLLAPSKDLQGVVRRRATARDTSRCTRILYGQLLRWQPETGQWVRLMDPEANPFWTEHGDRSVLNGWAAELDLPKDQRDKLGRWVPEQ
eukprot:4022424-Karenia_brevis.AAC.1